jgi:DNA-binding MarR family transcriptional regulator
MAALKRELKQTKSFESPEQEAFLNLHRTASFLGGPFMKLLKENSLSQPLYNILRILRGQQGGGLSCSHISERMVTRDPDVTRLVDRLEKSALVKRNRSAVDRRVVEISITRKGLQLLSRLDDPMRALHTETLGHLTRADLKELNRLLVKARNH